VWKDRGKKEGKRRTRELREGDGKSGRGRRGKREREEKGREKYFVRGRGENANLVGK